MTTEKTHFNKYDYSRRFDVHKWSDYPQVKKLTAKLYNEIVVTETLKKARTAKDAKKLERTLRIVLIDLFAAWQEDENLYIAYPRGSDLYNDDTRYANIYIKFKPMMQVTDYLKEHEYIEHRLGNKFSDNEGRVSRMRATDKLKKLFTNYKVRVRHVQVRKEKELIQKKDENKKLEDYDDNRNTIKMRKNIERINEHMNTFDINLHVTNEEEATIKKKLLEKRIKYGEINRFLNFSSDTLYRVFNNSSFKQGGRFYGVWWHSIPSEYRKHITIDGMKTVELDFSTMHMTMLYSRVDAELEGDAYTLDGYSSENLAAEDYGTGDYAPELRKGVKKLTNAMLNAKDGKIDRRKFEEYKWPDGKKTDDVKLDILARHKPIAEYFNSGEGVKLQYIDSKIAEQVMLKVIDRLNAGYFHRAVVLPVHDSFIIPISLLKKHTELMGIMQETFMEEIGLAIDVDYKTKEAHGVYTQYELDFLAKRNIDGLPTSEDIVECKKQYKEEYSNYYARGADYNESLKEAPEETKNVLKRKTNSHKQTMKDLRQFYVMWNSDDKRKSSDVEDMIKMIDDNTK